VARAWFHACYARPAKEDSMTKKKPLTSMLLAAFCASLLITAAPLAFAWTRTIGYRGGALYGPNAYTYFVYTSDVGWTGAPSGNAASTIYVDFSTNGATGTANVTLQACAYAYNGSGGGCGSATTSNYAANGVYDVSIAKWVGTGSQYDYFYVTFINNSGYQVNPMGVAVVGP
jgi:hypothetical protein